MKYIYLIKSNFQEKSRILFSFSWFRYSKRSWLPNIKNFDCTYPVATLFHNWRGEHGEQSFVTIGGNIIALFINLHTKIDRLIVAIPELFDQSVSVDATLSSWNLIEWELRLWGILGSPSSKLNQTEHYNKKLGALIRTQSHLRIHIHFTSPKPFSQSYDF